MVDVSAKAETHRIARARGQIRMLPPTLALIEGGLAKKGDVLGVARIAAIQAAKRTAELIPLCHPLPITRVAIDFDIDRAASVIRCTAQVETRGRTGVEMEALTAVPADHLRHVQGRRPRHGDGRDPGAGKTWRPIGRLVQPRG